MSVPVIVQGEWMPVAMPRASAVLIPELLRAPPREIDVRLGHFDLSEIGEAGARLGRPRNQIYCQLRLSGVHSPDFTLPFKIGSNSARASCRALVTSR